MQGVSPILATSIITRSDLDSEVQWENAEESLQNIHTSWQEHIKNIENEQYSPGIMTGLRNSMYLSVTLQKDEAYPGSVMELVDAYYQMPKVIIVSHASNLEHKGHFHNLS